MKNKPKKVKLYMCGVDWQHEIGSAGDTRLYESIEDLKRNRKCVKQCGIVELEATLKEVKWPQKQDFSKVWEEE